MVHTYKAADSVLLCDCHSRLLAQGEGAASESADEDAEAGGTGGPLRSAWSLAPAVASEVKGTSMFHLEIRHFGKKKKKKRLFFELKVNVKTARNDPCLY